MEISLLADQEKQIDRRDAALSKISAIGVKALVRPQA